MNVNLHHLQDQNTLLKAQRNNNVIIDESEPSSQSESSTEKLMKQLEALRLDNERLQGQLEQQQSAKDLGMPVVSIFRMHLQCFAKGLISLTRGMFMTMIDWKTVFTVACRTEELAWLSNLLPPNLLPLWIALLRMKYLSYFISKIKNAYFNQLFIHSSNDEDVQVCSFFRPESSANTMDLELKTVRSRLDAMEAELAETKRCLSVSIAENAELKEEIDRLKKDQEDLLVLLADQDGKVQKYKDRLKTLGQTVFFNPDYF